MTLVFVKVHMRNAKITEVKFRETVTYCICYRDHGLQMILVGRPSFKSY